MKLKIGYKNTEVGVIPEDWEVKKLGDITFLKRGKFTPRPRNNPIYYGGNIPFVQTGDVTKSNGKIINFTQTLNEEGLAVSTLFKKGTILMTIAANIGYTGILQIDMACPDSLVAIDGLGKTDNDFLNFYFSFKREKLEELATTGAQMNLNIERLSPFNIPLPPTKAEQTAIATALSDADALINGLEKLIAKKRNIKQGAMQKLLQPKEGWEVKSIFQIADSKKELFDDGDWIESEHITDKGIRLIQTGNIGIGKFIEKESRKYIYKESFEKLGCKLLKVGDLLICRLAEPAGRACIFPFIGEEKVITSVDVTIYRPREEIVNRQFLNQIFSTNLWFNLISDLCGGTTHKRISRGALGRIKILLPNFTEQIQIATILSDMDNEITALETKVEKYKKVKLGMMQNLLTGKIRLV